MCFFFLEFAKGHPYNANMHIGQEIKQYRSQYELSQADFAAIVDVTVGAVHRWESGERSPRGAVLRRVRAVLESAATRPRVAGGEADLLTVWAALTLSERYEYLAAMAKRIEGRNRSPSGGDAAKPRRQRETRPG